MNCPGLFPSLHPFQRVSSACEIGSRDDFPCVAVDRVDPAEAMRLRAIAVRSCADLGRRPQQCEPICRAEPDPCPLLAISYRLSPYSRSCRLAVLPSCRLPQSVAIPAMWVATFRGTGVRSRRGGVRIGRKASAVRITRLSRSIPVNVPRAIAVRSSSSGVSVRVGCRAVIVCRARASGESPLHPLTSRVRTRPAISA